MTITFRRPLGPHRDMKELEYVSALHQSSKKMRVNGSVTAKDVRRYLISRHGVQVDMDYIKKHLMPGLAGALGDDDDDHNNDGIVFDLCEIASILMIPFMIEEANDPQSDVFEKIYRYILLDVLGTADDAMSDVEPPKLDRAFMTQLLETYGEFDVAPQIIDKLLLQATAASDDGDGGDARFTVETLMEACTSDLGHYKLEWARSTSTHYDDVFKGTALDLSADNSNHTLSFAMLTNKKKKKTNVDDEDDPNNKSTTMDEEMMITQQQTKFDGSNAVTHLRTLPSIDYIAENYASKSFVTIVWTLVVVLYFTYVLNVNAVLGGVTCSRFGSEFACRVVNAIVAWLVIFVQLSVLGVTFVMLASFGNSIYKHRSFGTVASILIGMFTVVVCTILSYNFQIHVFIFNTKHDGDQARNFQGLLIVILGCFLLLFQLKALLLTFVDLSQFEVVKSRFSFVQRFLIPGMAQAELSTKRAARFKTRRMVADAIAMHEGTLAGSTLVETDRQVGSTFSLKEQETHLGATMLNFQATMDDTETVGGVFWAWRRILNGTLFSEEGIWIHSRLYGANWIHAFILLFYTVLYGILIWVLGLVYAGGDATDAPTASPAPTIDPLEQAAQDVFSVTGIALQQIVEWIGPYEGVTDRFWPLVGFDVTLILTRGILNSLNETQIEALLNEVGPDIRDFILNFNRTELIANITNGTGIDDAILNITNNVIGALNSSDPSGRYLAASAVAGGDYQQWEDNTNTFSRMLQEEEEEDSFELEDLIPKFWMTILSSTIGYIAAFVATVTLFLIWLPSASSTILQFRSAVIPSLRDQSFDRYRVAPDLTTILFGSVFWGGIFGTGLVFILFTIVTFLICYQWTRPIALQIVAQVIGIAVTLVVKIVILLFLRKSLFAGFFRRTPAGANFLFLVFECWNLALTFLTTLQRLVKLILIAAFYVGRLDTPMLADGVGDIGPAPLDSYPVQFRKDLLLHEAHRHPYMERLGVMYMLKLCYGSEFACKDGSTWRLIATFALFPWIRRYRIDDEQAELPEEGEIEGYDLKKSRRHILNTSAIQGSKDDDDDDDQEGNVDEHPGGIAAAGTDPRLNRREQFVAAKSGGGK